MKKQIFITAIAIILGTISINAQKEGDFELGIGFGGQFSSDWHSTDAGSRFEPLKSLGVGISAEYYFSDKWGIKMKLLYDPKGWSGGFTPDPYAANPFIRPTNNLSLKNAKASHELNYLTIPIMANLHFGKNKNWYFNFGPYFGFLLDARDSAFGLNLANKLYTDRDFGLAYGIGYKHQIKDNLHLFIEYDSQVGFENISKKRSETYRNRRMSLNFGVLFSL